jgi:hypothetical protein
LKIFKFSKNYKKPDEEKQNQKKNLARVLFDGLVHHHISTDQGSSQYVVRLTAHGFFSLPSHM